MTRLTDAAEARLEVAARQSQADGPATAETAMDDHVAYGYFPEAREFEAMLCGIVASTAQPLIDLGVPRIFPAENPLTGERGLINYAGALHTAVITAFAMGLAAGQALADEVNVSDEDVARFMDGL